MRQRWIPGAYGRGAVLLLAFVLSACPVPLPSGYIGASRENLDIGVRNQLKKGVTTRADVLLLLGEPDGIGPDDAWFAYGSVYGRGGVLFVLFAGGGAAGAGGEKMEYRRLVISFDPQGLMTDADFVDRECWEGIVGVGSGGGRSPPCLKIDAPNGTDAAAPETHESR